MKQAKVAELQRRISEIGRASSLGPRLRQVAVEPADDGVGGEFLRVSLTVDHPERLDWPEVEPLVSAIWDSVQAVDDRIPSIRFPDAA